MKWTKILEVLLKYNEIEQMQTIDKNYTNVCGASRNQRHHMIGNGFTVDIIKHILSHLQNNKNKNVFKI